MLAILNDPDKRYFLLWLFMQYLDLESFDSSSSLR